MFDRPGPRLFGLPPGADFPRHLLIGLEQRLSGAPPEAWVRVEIFVNTRRMQRRLMTLFAEGPARLLPRIRLVSDLGDEALLPPPVPPLRRRLELAQLVSGLLDQAPDLAPRAALFDLSDSLASLMDEMQGEGVDPQVLHDLDVAHLSAHWERSRRFIEIVERYFGADAQDSPDAEARNRRAAEALAARWADTPPDHPVIVAGSTGSRGAVALFMAAVARLPQGAVVLPGYDFDQPARVWDRMEDALSAEDHPQFRFRRLMDMLGTGPEAVRPWRDGDTAPCPARNRLVSLALRPAPVTDQWLDEGQTLDDLAAACADLTLIEAPSPRAEAQAIALRLRKAAEDGQTAALITPDRLLTRQVTAALDRWGIRPDDSAGMPLQLSAPGRLLRHVAGLFGQRMTAEALLTLLKHPLTASGGTRGQHLIWTHELELHVRRDGLPFPDGAALARWAARKNGKKEPDPAQIAWAEWLGTLLDPLKQVATLPLQDHVALHLSTAEALAAGPDQPGSGALWNEAAGEAARAAMADLTAEAPHGGPFRPRDYRDLVGAILSRGEVREAAEAHPGIMIWGTLEARVQGADLVILAGLNEGTWPQLPPPDPWLNREMRAKSGLLLPERRIGLAAHDFQQAIGAREVVLSRAVRDAEAETVPARWLNRMVNLMSGLDPQGGPDALTAMRARGAAWLRLAARIEAPEAPVPPAPRPAPAPPAEARPGQLSVTRIQTLIRDPYAIYARYVLGLPRLDSLSPEPDAPLRGTILHKVMERFIGAGLPEDPETARQTLLAIADAVFADHAPWPAARRLWRARLERVAGWFIDGEIARQAGAHPIALERRGRLDLPQGLRLTAEADRIDQTDQGRLVIYDYKTGAPPSAKQMEHYDKQLILEAAMAEAGAFDQLAATPVDHVAHIGLGSAPKVSRYDIAAGDGAAALAELGKLLALYADPDQGYAARRALFKDTDISDYDHLSRLGEWSLSDDPVTLKVGR